MSTIGFDTTSGMGGYTASVGEKHTLMRWTAARHTPGVNETLTEVGWHHEGSGDADVEVGVYNNDTLALIGAAIVSCTGSAGRKTAPCSGSLVAGQDYVIGFRPLGSVSGYKVYEAENVTRHSALTGSSPLANPFVWDSTSEAYKYAAFATSTPASSAPTISSQTESPLTHDAVTLGCTTTGVGTGTLYLVRAITSIFAGVTAAQVKAGQNAAGNTTGVTAGSQAHTTDTTPSIGLTGLTPAATYYGALMFEDASGMSNVITFDWTMSATPVNKGIRITDIYQPNVTALVADVTGATLVVYDAVGGTELLQSTINIVNGDCEIDSDVIGALAATPFVIIRWTVSSNENVYAATETVIDLAA